VFRKLWTTFRSSRQPRSSRKVDRLFRKPLDNPMILDLLWGEFIDSGNLDAVRRIVSVLDWEDLVRNRLQCWLSEIRPEMWAEMPYKDYQRLLIRCDFPIDYDRRSIDGPFDLDIYAARLALGHKLKFAELPIALSPKELVRLGMKSAALWSLSSMAEQYDSVAVICDQESKKPGGAARIYLPNVRPHEERIES